MFDYVTCKYPLPHGANQLTGWQTKDTPEQFMDTYEIREDGSLWHHEHDIEDRSDPNAEGLERLAGCMTAVNHRWVSEPLTGEVRFYTYEGRDTTLWWEFSAYFVNGQLKHLETIRTPTPEGGG